jgi:3-mercaptopyruvate sulfurtransferase SseA
VRALLADQQTAHHRTLSATLALRTPQHYLSQRAMLTTVALVALLAVSTAWGKGYSDDDDDGYKRPGRPHPKKCSKHNVCEETPLITPAELDELLGSQDPPVLLDVYTGARIITPGGTPAANEGCTTDASYMTEHVAGAFPIDWRCDLSNPARYYELPAETSTGAVDIHGNPIVGFEEKMQERGLDLDTPIVVYDRGDRWNHMAVRALFVLEYFGFTNIKMVDGGLNKIKADMSIYPLTNIVIEGGNGPDLNLITPSAVDIVPDNSLITDAVFVGENLDNKFVNLIDARPARHYYGWCYDDPVTSSFCAGDDQIPCGMDPNPTEPRADKLAYGGAIHTGERNARPGHIPGCYNRPWAENYNWWNQTGNTFVTFKPAHELAQIYSRFLETQKTAVTICNEGIHAVLDAFVLRKILCFENVLVYEGSHAEWADLPFDSSEQDKSTPLTLGCEYGGSECDTKKDRNNVFMPYP